MDVQQAPIDVQDIYSWRASYSDGEYLDEMHAVGGFASVDQERCTALTLLYTGTVPIHTVHIPIGAKPVFFRRRRIAVNIMEKSSEPQPTTHCIGWKRREDDAVYLFVDECGNALLSSNLQEVIYDSHNACCR